MEVKVFFDKFWWFCEISSVAGCVVARFQHAGFPLRAMQNVNKLCLVTVTEDIGIGCFDWVILVIFKFDCKYDFLAFELVMLTTRSSAIIVVNSRTATRFDPTTIPRTLVKNLVVPKSRTFSPAWSYSLSNLKAHANGRNKPQHCCVLLANNVASVCIGLNVWLVSNYIYATSANIVVVPCKRTQHVGPNNVACCWPTMLRLFAWALKVSTVQPATS